MHVLAARRVVLHGPGIKKKLDENVNQNLYDTLN